VQDSGGSGMSPAPYGNWLGRVAFNFTPKATLQFGEWRETAAFPFTNGWELNKKATDSNVYAVNFLYRTNPFNDKYPKTYEVMFYHNTAVQAPPGTAFSPYGPPIPTFTTKAHDGTSGMYVGARQMVYRPDGGKGGPFPTRALSVFANDITSFDQANTTGVATQANAGIILDAPFKSRPHDSLSLKMQFLHVTNDEQNFMKAANLAAGGSGYTVGPTEFGIGPDANIILPGPIVLCPYAVRSFNANTFMNPWFAGKPQNGWAAGIVMVFLLDKASGLAPAH
jgi:porin